MLDPRQSAGLAQGGRPSACPHCRLVGAVLWPLLRPPVGPGIVRGLPRGRPELHRHVCRRTRPRIPAGSAGGAPTNVTAPSTTARPPPRPHGPLRRRFWQPWGAGAGGRAPASSAPLPLAGGTHFPKPTPAGPAGARELRERTRRPRAFLTLRASDGSLAPIRGGDVRVNCVDLRPGCARDTPQQARRHFLAPPALQLSPRYEQYELGSLRRREPQLG